MIKKKSKKKTSARGRRRRRDRGYRAGNEYLTYDNRPETIFFRPAAVPIAAARQGDGPRGRLVWRGKREPRSTTAARGVGN